VNLLLALLLSARLAAAQEDIAFEAMSEPPLSAPLTEDADIEAQTTRVASLLRCPVCQGLSVAESREGLSLAMKDRIREMVTAGYTQDQIIDYFVERYGETIVLLPDQKHWLVWSAPVAALLLGLGYVGWRASRPAPADAPQAAPTEPAPEAPADEYRRRILAELEDV